MQINIGNLNKKIDIISYQITKDEDGFPIKTENIVLSTWSQVTNTSGTKIVRSNSDFSETKTRFLITTSLRENVETHYVRFKNPKNNT